MSRLLPCMLLLALSAACVSLPAAEPRAWSHWSRRQGGVVAAGDAAGVTQRADAALARVAAHCACPAVAVRVLDNDRAEAFGWRDGSVFVTRGLVELLDADELAAAIAHEIGHLGGRGDGLPNARAEEFADEIGSELLRANGIAPEQMLSMLTKLSAESAPDRRIATRIAALRGRLEESGPRASLLASLD